MNGSGKTADGYYKTGDMPQILSLTLFVDLERLCRAINGYIASSSTFQTGVTRNADGKLCYRHCPELVKEIRVERLSATDAKEAIRTFVRPFSLLEGLPYRIRLICTGLHKCLLFDIHHIFTDGEEEVNCLCNCVIDALKRLISGDGSVVRDYLR